MLSSKKVKFFLFFISRSVDFNSCDLCDDGHGEKDKNKDSDNVKHKNLILFVVHYNVTRWEMVSNEKVKFFSFIRSKNVRPFCSLFRGG